VAPAFRSSPRGSASTQSSALLDASATAPTLEITVERDASLSLKVPDQATSDQITAFVAAKRSWIFRKLAEKDALFHPPVVKQLVDGEGFAYLGRSHRLLLVENDQDVPARLELGRLRVRRADVSSDGVAVIRRWYQRTGRFRAEQCGARCDVAGIAPVRAVRACRRRP